MMTTTLLMDLVGYWIVFFPFFSLTQFPMDMVDLRQIYCRGTFKNYACVAIFNSEMASWDVSRLCYWRHPPTQHASRHLQ